MRRVALWIMLVLPVACGPRLVGDVPIPPEALLAPCVAPQVWQAGRGLSQSEVEILWGRDRAGLRDCAARQGLLAGWAQDMAGAER